MPLAVTSLLPRLVSDTAPKDIAPPPPSSPNMPPSLYLQNTGASLIINSFTLLVELLREWAIEMLAGAGEQNFVNRSENSHYWHFRMRFANIQKNFWDEDWEMEDLEELAILTEPMTGEKLDKYASSTNN